MSILRVKSGTEKGKVYKVAQDTLVLGRDSACEIQVLDQGVSRRHSEIFRIGEMFFIRDLQSRNHTYVNEKEVSEDILRIGDQVRIGNTVLAFEDHAAQSRDSSRVLRTEEEPRPLQQPTSTLILTRSSLIPSREEEEDKATREARSLDVFLHLSHIIAEEKNLSKIFEKVSELLGKSLGADHAYIFGIAADRKEVGEVAGAGILGGNGKNERREFDLLGRFDGDAEGDATAGVSRGIIRECLENNRSVLTSDASLDQQFNAMASVVMNQLRSVICVPISVLGKSLGAIYLYSKRAEAFYTEDLELASAVGIQLGSTIELLKQLRRSDQFFRQSIQTIVSAAEMRTPTPRGVSERIASYCLAISKELGWDTQESRDAWLAGMLHDIGSIAMTDKELESDVTRETKKNHYARELLRDIPELARILPAIENQKERHDGSGSPEGKKGDAIPPLARVLGIALELDRQLYGEGIEEETRSVKDALVSLRELADRSFDRGTVNAVLIAYRNGRLFNPQESFFEATG